MNTRMINAKYYADIIVISDEPAIAIRKLSTGKLSGLDGIYAEHLFYCSQRFVTVLTMCFTGLFVHGTSNALVFCQIACSKLYLYLLSRIRRAELIR